MLSDHAVQLSVTGDGEVECHPDPVQRGCAAAEQPHHRRHVGDAERLVPVLRRLQCDVVAEPARLFVRVGVAAHVDQQCGVVEGRALCLVEPGQLADLQRDATLPQYVLHRLVEAEVDPERERGE